MAAHIRSRLATVVFAVIAALVLVAAANTVVAQLVGASFAAQHAVGNQGDSKDPIYLDV